MALRDQPYLPLFIQDFLTDEKLIECSAAATGVYVRLMCIMHKSNEYGKILLKQKDKQTDNQINNFASKLAKQMPYGFDIICSGLNELITENVLCIDGDYLYQKRMVTDNELSLKRSKSGKIGGIVSSKNKKDFAQANSEANSEDEDENNSIIPEMKIVAKNDVVEIEELGSERVSVAANLVWKDGRWKENFCMGNSVTMEELSLWMAKFNASVCNDRIPDFTPSKYKKMLQGWVVAQKAKGTKVEPASAGRKSEAAPLTRLKAE